jgi:pumilio homology domain family member 6
MLLFSRGSTFWTLILVGKAYKGELPKLAVHGVAAKVVESIFLNLPPKATAPLRQEFYGPHFSLFAQEFSSGSTTASLKTNLANAKTETQKAGALKFVKDILNKGMTKGFYGYTYFQRLLAEYVEVAEGSEIRAMASNVADHTVHLLSTRAGAEVVAACASYGTPKDRKRICKSLKGYTSSSLLHRDAYLALLRLVQVTDDTVSIHKSILHEILTAPAQKDKTNQDGVSTDNTLLNLALSDTGSKLFLMLVVQDDGARMKYFDPYERSILEPLAMIKENGQEVPTSKKDSETKRQELLKHISEALIAMCTENAGTLVTSLPGSRVLKEVYAAFPSENLGNAIAKVCEASLEAKGGEEEDKTNNNDSVSYSVFEDPIGHRTIKNIILHDSASATPFFSNALVERIGERLVEVAESNRGAFVAGSLLKVNVVKVRAKNALKSHLKVIQKKSKGEGTTAGFAALLKEMSAN